MEFHIFSEKVNAKFNAMAAQEMFTVDIDRSTLSNNYLKAFPAGSDPLFIERTAHDCQTCRQFIKFVGTAVTINIDGSLDTVWDIDGLESPYLEVAADLASQVKAASIKSIFLHNEHRAGKENSVQLLADKSTRIWQHLWADIPDKFYTRNLATLKSKAESRASVHKRSLTEISIPTLDTVIGIIESDSVYRGVEHLAKVVSFREIKKAYETTIHKDSYVWLTYRLPGAGIRNTVIGSLIADIEEVHQELDTDDEFDIDIELAIAKFTSKVAPANYKRPKAVVTKRMLEDAIKVIDEKDIRTALPRRQAIASDMSVNDVIFADRSVKMSDQDPLMGMLDTQPTEVKGIDNAPEISMEDFIETIVPTSTNISIVTSNYMSANKIQISAPVDSNAKNILQWDNNFAWSYSGNITDSDIARNVKAAGGKVDGFLRCSLQWNEDLQDPENDLDLHCIMPRSEIYYGNKKSAGGTLDIDIKTPGRRTAVENITWPSQSILLDGTYKFFVKNYSGRNSGGFRAEIAIGNETYNYDFNNPANNDVSIATVTVKNGTVTIEHHMLHSTSNSSELVPVKLIMLSPNHWGQNRSGNKHFIFITDEEQETAPFRGFYNEFIAPDLHDIRKSLDMLASKMMCEPVEGGLAGYGFSSTKRTSVFIKADHKLFKVVL